MIMGLIFLGRKFFVFSGLFFFLIVIVIRCLNVNAKVSIPSFPSTSCCFCLFDRSSFSFLGLDYDFMIRYHYFSEKFLNNFYYLCLANTHKHTHISTEAYLVCYKSFLFLKDTFFWAASKRRWWRCGPI